MTSSFDIRALFAAAHESLSTPISRVYTGVEGAIDKQRKSCCK